MVAEVHAFNAGSVAVAIGLTRLASAGTPGAGLTEDPAIPVAAGGPAASCTGFNTHTGAPTLGNPTGYRATLGAAMGVIWTFPRGLWIPVGVANGIGIIVTTGTGQALDFTFVWDE